MFQTTNVEALCPPDETADRGPELLFPCTGGKTWALWEDKLAEYCKTFPDVDVEAECRRAWQWCQDHPAKQKTARAMPQFMSRWLDNHRDDRPRREEDAGHHHQLLAVLGRIADNLEQISAYLGDANIELHGINVNMHDAFIELRR